MERVRLPLESLELPESGRVDVWLADLAGWPLPAGDEPTDRGGRVRGLRFRRQFVLRLLLGAYTGQSGARVRILHDPSGKPRLGTETHTGNAPEISISKAGSWLAVAVGGREPLGVDIEPAGREIPARRLARRYFRPAECAALEALPESERSDLFLRLWTAKEALIKARGATIAGSLARVGVHGGPPAAIESLPPDWPAASDWSLAELGGLPGLIGHLAVIGPVESIHMHRLVAPDPD